METSLFEEYGAIRAVLHQYVQAGIEGRSDVMKDAFHPDAIMYGQVDGRMTGGPIQRLYDLIDRAGPATELQVEIPFIEIHETIASARVDSVNWNGFRYSDMFLLIKEDGRWKILTKVFHINP